MDKSFQCDNYFSEVCLEDTMETMNQMFYLATEYNIFIEEVEEFFNKHLSEGDLEKFGEDSFELTDSLGLISFPFTIRDKRLKLIESDSLKAIIMSAIVQKNTNRRKRNEKLNRTKLQHISSQQL